MIMVLVLIKTTKTILADVIQKKCVGYIVREGSRWRIKRQKSI